MAAQGAVSEGMRHAIKQFVASGELGRAGKLVFDAALALAPPVQQAAKPKCAERSGTLDYYNAARGRSASAPRAKARAAPAAATVDEGRHRATSALPALRGRAGLGLTGRRSRVATLQGVLEEVEAGVSGAPVFKRGDAEVLRPSAFRSSWKPCTLQLNKRSLMLLKLSHGFAASENDRAQHVVKTYHALDLCAVRYCARSQVPNVFEVCTEEGEKVRVRVADTDKLEQWLGALRHNMAFLR